MRKQPVVGKNPESIAMQQQLKSIAISMVMTSSHLDDRHAEEISVVIELAQAPPI
jgi:hypothetical protein